MVFPPGQGKHGEYLMNLWRQYLSQYAEREGSVEQQIVVGAYHATEVFGSLSLTLDREGRFSALIHQRIYYFQEGTRRAEAFADCMINATFSLYNHLNTLSHQFIEANPDAKELIRLVDEQVKMNTQAGDLLERSAAAARAAFPLLGLMTLVLDQGQRMTSAIQEVERRFAAGDARATTGWEHILNAIYRLVEMMQIFVALSDEELKDQAQQIATRFQEEDQTSDILVKLRNGFCRLFELGHLLTTHLDASLTSDGGSL